MNSTEQGIAFYLGKSRLSYLQQQTVGIAGAGGLGSNCAIHLVRSGFKRFVLVDFDRVDLSNLNRQAYRADQVGQFKVEALSALMQAVNPDVRITAHIEKCSAGNLPGFFAECDVIVEAFDGPKYKKALVEAFLPTGKLVVAASGMGGTGNTDAMITRRVSGNLYVVGDGETECTKENPPFLPRWA